MYEKIIADTEESSEHILFCQTSKFFHVGECSSDPPYETFLAYKEFPLFFHQAALKINGLAHIFLEVKHNVSASVIANCFEYGGKGVGCHTALNTE